MAATTEVNQVKINVLTQAQYDNIQKNPTELYMITDATLDFNDLLNKPVVFVGANGILAGTSGLVPAPTATDNTKFLKGDSTWADVSVSTLTDTNLINPVADQVLTYNGTEWVNETPSPFVVVNHTI